MDNPDPLVVDHPLLKRDLTILRNKDTSHGDFRRVISEASAILAYEAMRTLSTSTKQVETPIEWTIGYAVASEVVVVPILRAGLSMVDGFVRFVPEARIGHIGMYRDERTHLPVDYYASIPYKLEAAKVYLVDPMLATGGSAIGAIRHLKSQGANDITFVCVIASPEGIKAVKEAHPDVAIVTGSVDRELNGEKFICPGLGDAGDRTFGTVQRRDA